MQPVETPASGLKVLLTVAGSLLAAFVCGVMKLNADGNDHDESFLWWVAALALVTIVLICSYSLLRDHRVGKSLAIVLAPVLTIAQCGAIALLVLVILESAL